MFGYCALYDSPAWREQDREAAIERRYAALAAIVLWPAFLLARWYFDGTVPNGEVPTCPAILAALTLCAAAIAVTGYLRAYILRPIWKFGFSRLWYGQWMFIEQTGEWSRIVGHDEHGPLIDPMSRSQRRGVALVERRERRLRLFVFTITWLLAAAVVADFFLDHSQLLIRFCGNGSGGKIAQWGILLFSPIWLLGVIFPLLGDAVTELLYLSGFQRMPNARAIDPEPIPLPGVDTVVGQKGHGKAGPADRWSIADILRGKRTRESNLRFGK